MMDLIDRNLIGDLVDSNGNVHYEDIMNIPSLELPPVQPVDKDINVSCKDAISRQAAIDIFDDYNVSVENGELEAYSRDRKRLCDLPSVQPYTDEQIQKIQDMESAEIEKAFVLGREDAVAEIIHCKDCKYWMPYDWMFSEVWQSKNMDDYPEKEIGCVYCDMNMSANDFCSRSERRADEPN